MYGSSDVCSSVLGFLANWARSSSSSARSESRWLETETYSPTAIERAPAVTAAIPATSNASLLTSAPATPTTIPDRKTVGSGKREPVRVDLGGRRSLKKKKKQ